MRVSVEELYSVGALGGDGADAFGRIGAVAFAPDGALYILDEEAARVVAVTSGGGEVRPVADRGEGPGELSAPVGLAVLPDGRVVVNDLLRGFHVFEEDGSYGLTIPFDQGGGVPDSEIRSGPDGSVLATIRRRVVGSTSAEGQLARYPIVEGAPAELLTNRSPAGQGPREIAPGLSFPLLFGPTVRFTVASDGAVFVARGVDYEVEVRRPTDGRWTSLITRSVEPLPVTNELVEAEIARRVGRRATEFRQLGAATGLDAAAMRAMVEQMTSQMPVAELVPVVDALGVDHDDRIWIERYGGGVSSAGPIDIFSRTGELVGTVSSGVISFPDAFGPIAQFGFVENDGPVPVVRVRRLTVSP